MVTYKIHKTRDYTVMSNIHLRDKDMSLKAKGLLSVMLSLPDTWDYSINGLVAICKENNTAVESALKELKALGYLTVTKKMPNETKSGRIEYEYDIYESPAEAQKQGVEKQGVEKQGVEILPIENSPQLNTNELNTYKSNTYDKKERKKDSFDKIIADFTSDAKTTELLQEWLKVRKEKRAAMTDRAIQLNINKLVPLAQQSKMEVNTYLEEVISRGWAAFYEIKQYNNNSGYKTEERQTINGKEYIYKNGKYYIPNGSGIAVNPNAEDDLPF